MIKTIVYGVVGGLLGALSAGSVKTAISMYKEYKECKESLDITPAFQEAFSEKESDGAFTVYNSNEHKNVYLFDFESMHPEIDGLTFERIRLINPTFYDKIESGMYAVPGKGDANNA